MKLEYLELTGFKSFAKKTRLSFESQVTAVVGPNGSGKSNVAEAFRWVLGEQSLKSLRGKRGEDLIFNGGNTAGRMNRAEVSICFDNVNRQFNLDYDRVILTRKVFRDGSNEYEINGSQVRLKDIIELLSNVSLGSSGHHIISQGEADRILNAGLRGRREMIEEALGLKIYHWKIAESEKRLDRTLENIKQVGLLRREIAPHLKFLKKQVEKIEQADELRRELKQLYLIYFKLEEQYLSETRLALQLNETEPATELEAVTRQIDEMSGRLHRDGSDSDQQARLAELEHQSREQAAVKDDLSRRIGRLEGMIEVKAETKIETASDQQMVDLASVRALAERLDGRTSELDNISDPHLLKDIINEFRNGLRTLLERFVPNQGSAGNSPVQNDLTELKRQRDDLVGQLEQVTRAEANLQVEIVAVKQAINIEKEKMMGAERELYELKARKNELRSALDIMAAKREQINRGDEDFKRELAEAVTIVDQEVMRYQNFELPGELATANTDRSAQDERRRKIERFKIRLEEMGLPGGDVLEEYKETTKRDEVLATELSDLEQGAEGLRQVMTELKSRLSDEFTTGITKINIEFAKYFSLMFGGGTAALQVVAETKRRRKSALTDILTEEPEEESEEEGIDIYVNLPRKKIKGLQMLSGGERALTSIALLFAMSQVNPPPFLILDETDAALDEANSRKYGEMIAGLSQQSQLILITHNRETMSRAGVLYGVTMDADGISKLLSIKFDEAENYAK